VKYLEVANVRALVQELRHGIEAAAWQRAREWLERARRESEEARSRLEGAAAQARAALATFRRRTRAVRAEAEREMAAALEQALEETRRAAIARQEALRRRAEEAIDRLRQFLEEFAARREAFVAWVEALRVRAGRYAKELPPPPQPPEVPEDLRALAVGGVASLLGTDTVPSAGSAFPHPRLPELPPLPELPELSLPEFPEAFLPGTIELRETSVTGAPERLNTFDQNVPGFSVTFLLLGMLLGVSLSLLDERHWGTLARLRTTPTPFSALLVGKLLARFGVGMVQMTLLFLFGWIAFGISLGPEPWALWLPIGGIVFAGTALGLAVAAVAPSRESVLPVGSIVIVTMAAVGGCWWPIDLEPRWMRQAALAFPTTWAMAAFNDLMIRRQGVEAALRPTAVLFGYGAATLLLGVLAFRRRF
jgi:ABC-type multidrug transport system permease subunit